MKKLQTLLYVVSIVVAIGIGMTQVTAKNFVVGNEPCASKISFDGGTCVKKDGVEGSCEDHYPTFNDNLTFKNARFDTGAAKTDYCDSQNSPCQIYDLYPSVSCNIE
jgi:hypothetical protein